MFESVPMTAAFIFHKVGTLPIMVGDLAGGDICSGTGRPLGKIRSVEDVNRQGVTGGGGETVAFLSVAS